MKINTFDCDGVIYLGKDIIGVYPGPNDIIITGRSFEEREETNKMLYERGITNMVFFNPLPFDQKTRETSGQHKARIISQILADGNEIGCHFEDDPTQAMEIKKVHLHLPIVMMIHHLITMENVRHI